MIIGSWEVDPKLNQLKQGEDVIRISPLAMDVLLHLANADGNVVGTAELIDRNWPENKGSDSALYKVMSELRRALSDTDRRDRKIESVSKRGYRLNMAVRVQNANAKIGQTTDPKTLLNDSMRQGYDRMAQSNYALAQRHFKVVVDLCQQSTLTEPNLESEANLRIGECLLQEQGKVSASPYFLRARDLALELQDHVCHAKALLGLSGNLQPHIIGESTSVRNQFQLVLRMLPKSEEDLRLRVRARIVSYSYPSSPEILEEARTVVQLSRRSKDSRVLLLALLALHESLRGLDKVLEQAEVGQEIFTLAQRTRDRDLSTVGYLRRISDLIMLGNLPEAKSIRANMDSLKPRVLYEDEISRIDACFATMQGNLDEAEQFATAVRFKEPGYLLMQFLQLIMVARFRGESERLLPLAESAAGPYVGLPAAHVFLALLYADIGQTKACEAEIKKLGEDLSGLNQDISWHAVLASLSEVAYLTNNKKMASLLMEKLKPYSGYCLVLTTVSVFGAADLYLGMLAEVLGEDAEQYFLSALRLNEQIEHHPLIERTRRLLDR